MQELYKYYADFLRFGYLQDNAGDKVFMDIGDGAPRRNRQTFWDSLGSGNADVRSSNRWNAARGGTLCSARCSGRAMEGTRRTSSVLGQKDTDGSI